MFLARACGDLFAEGEAAAGDGLRGPIFNFVHVRDNVYFLNLEFAAGEVDAAGEVSPLGIFTYLSLSLRATHTIHIRGCSSRQGRSGAFQFSCILFKNLYAYGCRRTPIPPAGLR
jgi:hypothetical protein